MKTVGIDLGTTNSCVYYLDENGEPVLVTDPLLGYKIFPSVVYCASAGEEILVGHKAKARVGHQPPPILAVKRKMGTTETLELGGERVTPAAVSALILGHAKNLVEKLSGDEVGAAVITIPAYFDAAPRKATHEAAVQAFFGGDTEAAQGRVELLLEPEAAAWAYTIEDPAERLRILVYDLGGGTFDVTILDKSPATGLSEIKFGGDPHLGGENFDDRLASWFLYLLRGGKPETLERIFAPGRYPEVERHAILLQLFADDEQALAGSLRADDRELRLGASAEPGYALDLDVRRPEDAVRIHVLKGLAEAAKKALTAQTETSIMLQNAFEDQNGALVEIDLGLSRGEFELLTGDLLARTLEETERVLAESGTGAGDIDRILLVGGSTRMPCVAERLAARFSCEIVTKDPDLIVARGACLRARDLAVVVGERGSGRRLALAYPRTTSDEAIDISGQLETPLSGYHAFLARDGQELAAAAIEDDRFLLADIPLLPDTENVFHLEIADDEDELYIEAELRVRHGIDAVAGGEITTKLSKAFRSQGIDGMHTLMPEGTTLPFGDTFQCERATQDPIIRIPFFEGEHELEVLEIPEIDPDLPIGAAIDVRIEIGKDYVVQAIATVRATGQSKKLDFQIPMRELPPLETLDQDLDDVLAQIENDLELVRDPNRRAEHKRRARQLQVAYRKARHELDTDRHKLFSTLSELRKLLADVRGAQTFLEPPLEVFERLLALCRQQAEGLEAGGPLPRADVLEKVTAHEQAGREAWEREDAATWKGIVADLEQLHKSLERAALPPPPDPSHYPPEAIQGAFLQWIQELREQVAEAGLEGRFGPQLDQLAAGVRAVDLHRADGARRKLLQILQDQLRPLDVEIKRAIAKATGHEPALARASTVRWQ